MTFDFVNVVREAFKYLESECGFAVSFTISSQVRYQRGRVFVVVFVDHRAGLAAVEFGHSDLTAYFCFDEFCGVLPGASNIVGEIATRDPDELGAFLNRLAIQARPALCALPDVPFEVFQAAQQRQGERTEANLAAYRRTREHRGGGRRRGGPQ